MLEAIQTWKLQSGLFIVTSPLIMLYRANHNRLRLVKTLGCRCNQSKESSHSHCPRMCQCECFYGSMQRNNFSFSPKSWPSFPSWIQAGEVDLFWSLIGCRNLLSYLAAKIWSHLLFSSKYCSFIHNKWQEKINQTLKKYELVKELLQTQNLEIKFIINS